ncbi:MAG: 3-oxoacyl-[acyl-carrier protein] reductase, partial [Maribacter sp.]
MFRLDNQVAIITGGARGIGEGICEVFCKAGAIVYMWDVLEAGKETAEKLVAKGYHISFQKVDITSKESVQAAVDTI